LIVTTADVYLAKSRTAARLKGIIDRFELIYDEDAS
jgi:hypothetical protein